MLNFVDLILSVQLGLSPVGVIGGSIVAPLEPINKSIVYLGFCTATLVGERTVVTAAHCLDMKAPFDKGVVYSVSQSGLPCASSKVKDIAVAPGAKFSQAAGHYYPDILLLKLETPLCGALPARLAERPVVTDEVFVGAGYGRGSVSKVLPTRLALRSISKTDGTLEKLYSDITPEMNPLISQNLETIRRDGFGHYEAAVGAKAGETLCNGDSGGPMYREPSDTTSVVELVGINGAIVGHELKGPEACHNGFLQLYTPVAPFTQWIRAQSSEWDANP